MAQLLADRERGAERPLEEYQALFPGHERAIEDEFREMEKPDEATDDSPTTDQDEILGPYRLVREIGSGGQGSVWLAEDTRIQRRVAIKVVPRSPLLGDLGPRLRREAEVTANLDHPGICAVYDVGVEEGVAWLAMRHVEGVTFDEWWTELPDGPTRTLRILEQVEAAARALHFAHEAGVVHRDIKPSNIMISRDDTPTVLDFGIAHQDEAGVQLTLSGDVLGTPAYMSPEQLDPTAAPLDGRTDVWALGVTLFEALTGDRPFLAPTRETLIRTILESEPPDLNGLEGANERDLRIVVQTALEKDLDRRYATALDFAEDLRRLREGESILARPASSFRKLRRWARRNPALASSILVLVLVVAGAYAVISDSLYETRKALAEKQAYFDDVTRLADQRLIQDLLDELELPRPLIEETADDVERWLRRAAEVSGRTELHRRAFEAAQARMASGERASPEIDRDEETDLWFVGQISKLLEDIETLDESIEIMRPRLEFARNLTKLTIDDHREAWDRAIADVAAAPRFDGFTLTPQRGLIPIGSDPESGLQEFALLQSGTVPERDADTGKITMMEDTAIVLVLLPGARTLVGAGRPQPGHPEGAPHVDPNAGPWDGPPRRVRLDPFFLSKYEMTQGQWQRQAGEDPTQFEVNPDAPQSADDRRHPVEEINVDDCRRILGQLGLVLPTEVQWEYGARAGTTTIFWTGNTIESVGGAANFADEYASRHGGHAGRDYSSEVDDGWVGHAPVGSFRPNAFGIHDTMGNVAEWTGSMWEEWTRFPPRDGDGLSEGEMTVVVWRGGSFTTPVLIGRSGMRDGVPPDLRSMSLGVRPARKLDV